MTKKIFVENNDRPTMKMMVDLGYQLTDDIDSADLLILSGGVDVNPELYGEAPHPRTDTPNTHRDNHCVMLYCRAVANGIPVVGICRGSQFLTVMQGGSLVQHLPQQQPYYHKIKMSEGPFPDLEVTSTHHQAMIPAPHIQVIGKCEEHDIVEVTIHERGGHGGPIELCVQGHPEWCSHNEDFFVWFAAALTEIFAD